jgi:hypothetical protein
MEQRAATSPHQLDRVEHDQLSFAKLERDSNLCAVVKFDARRISLRETLTVGLHDHPLAARNRSS